MSSASNKTRVLTDPKARASQLPFTLVNPLHWVSDKRPAPNPVIRGSLFGVLAKQDSERAFKNLLVYEDKNIQLTYTGQALGQADLDVWMNLVRKVGSHFAQGERITTLEFSPSSFLREIGRTGGVHKRLGRNDREWLYNSLIKLTGSITIASPDARRGLTGGLVRTVAWNDDADKIVIEVDNKFGSLFAGGYTCLSMDVRGKLRGDDLALWLHAFISSHNSSRSEFYYGLDILITRSRSQMATPRFFKRSIEHKMKKLMLLTQEERGFFNWIWEPGNILRVFFSEQQFHKWKYEQDKTASQTSIS